MKQSMKDWIQRDFTYICLLLLALIGCLYTLATVGNYQQQCNEHWVAQVQPVIDECDFYNQESFDMFNGSYQFNIITGDQNE